MANSIPASLKRLITVKTKVVRGGKEVGMGISWGGTQNYANTEEGDSERSAFTSRSVILGGGRQRGRTSDLTNVNRAL